MEPEIVSQVDPLLYQEHLELMEIALDVRCQPSLKIMGLQMGIS
jgi:hypothetical protein